MKLGSGKKLLKQAALKAMRETEKRNATERLHADIRELELKAPDYGVGK